MTMTLTYLLNANPMLAAFWMSAWFYLIVLALLSIAGFIFHKVRISALKTEKSEVERQLAERSELLRYATKDQQKALAEAEFAMRNQKELLAKISHEIRTPMNAMWGMASLLNETSLTGEQLEYTNTILHSGENLLKLINDILMKDTLQYSKIESDKELEMKDFDLTNAVEEVLEVFADKASLTGVDLLYKVDKNVPLQVVGDAQRLRQVLMNLIENAFRFTGKGEISVSVSLADQRAGDKVQLLFEVKDTGTGIEPDRLKKLMQDMEHSGTSNDAFSIAGLTLVICQRLVTLMGGNITVKSSIKEGTTFSFNITAGKSQKQSRNSLNNTITETQGKQALVVDDNINCAQLTSDLLNQWQLKTTVAHSAQQALDILAQDSRFNIIICDHYMPGVNGIAFAKEVKRLHQNIPVILLGKVADDTERQYPDLFRAVINKPVRQHLLHKEVVNALCGKPVHEQKSESRLSADFSQKYPLNILIAEDDAMNQQMVTMVLKKLGYVPTIASNGKEVLEIVSHHNFDLILMDVQMPEMDGLEATRMIRLCLSNQPIIIAMTANTLQGDREECLQAGMDDYLSKPVKLPALVSLLEKWALQEQHKHAYAHHE